MAYTIKEAAKIMNVTPTTLRYYDKQGLLPLMERKESGYRIFSENDMLMLRVIECLKKSGMSIKEIRQFTEWVLQGDASLQERYHMFLERKQAVEKQMAELQETLDFINHKCWYYETAIEAGTEKSILLRQRMTNWHAKNKPKGSPGFQNLGRYRIVHFEFRIKTTAG